MSTLVSNPILNVIAAAGADLTLLGRTVHLNGADSLGNQWIDMLYPGIDVMPLRPEILPSLHEILQKQTFTFVAANDTTYSFVISQEQPDGSTLVFPISVKSATTGATPATIATQINAAIASKAGAGLKVSSSGASTVITIVALTGYPRFVITNAVNGTVANAAALTIAFSASTDATPTVVTSVAHGLSTGDTVIPTGGTPLSPIAVAAGTQRRITVLSANTFSVAGTTATGTADVAGGTILLVPQKSRGQVADLVAQGITGTSSGGSYAQCLYQFRLPDTMSFDMARDRVYSQRLWVNELASNYAAFLTKWGEVNNAYNASAVTTNPETVALTQ